MSTHIRRRWGIASARRSMALLLLLVQVLAPAAPISRALAQGPSGGYGQLRVTTEDRPRPVWVGERYLGITPVVADSLATGAVELQIGEPLAERRWVVPYTRVAQVRRDQETRVDIPALQRLRVRTAPLPGLVRLFDRELGRTPLVALVPARETLDLHVSGRGLIPTMVRYDGAGRADSLLEVAVRVEGGVFARAEPRSASWFRQKEYLLPVGAVLAGAAGVWARQSADRAYEEYRSTIDLDELRTRFDRVRTYDRVAVGFWITAEVLLAAAAWTWLRGSADGADAPLVEVSARDGEARVGVSLGAWLRGGGDDPSR